MCLAIAIYYFEGCTSSKIVSEEKSGYFRPTPPDTAKCIDCRVYSIKDCCIELCCINRTIDSVWIPTELALGYVQHNGSWSGAIKLVDIEKNFADVDYFDKDIHWSYDNGMYLKKGDTSYYTINKYTYYPEHILKGKSKYAIVIYAPYVFCQDSLVVNIK
jgi:hypothetical protein